MKFRKKDGSGKPIVSAVVMAYAAGVTMFVVACVQLVLTFMFPVGKNTRPFDVYSRNISTVVVFVVLGLYLTAWSVYKSKQYHSRRTMKRFRILTIIVIAGCAIKTLLAAYYTVSQYTFDGFSWVYYLGEFFAWLFLTLYFVIYLQSKHKRKDETPSQADEKVGHHHHHHHMSEREIKLDKIAKNHSLD